MDTTQKTRTVTQVASSVDTIGIVVEKGMFNGHVSHGHWRLVSISTDSKGLKWGVWERVYPHRTTKVIDGITYYSHEYQTTQSL